MVILLKIVAEPDGVLIDCAARSRVARDSRDGKSRNRICPKGVAYPCVHNRPVKLYKGLVLH
jgi:hypothetical protein